MRKNLPWRLMLGCLAPLVVSVVLQASYTMASQRQAMIKGLEDKAASLANLMVNVVGPSIMVDDAKAVVRLQAMGAPVAFARLPSGDHFDYRLVIAELRTKVCPWLETVWQHP